MLFTALRGVMIEFSAVITGHRDSLHCKGEGGGGMPSSKERLFSRLPIIPFATLEYNRLDW